MTTLSIEKNLEQQWKELYKNQLAFLETDGWTSNELKELHGLLKIIDKKRNSIFKELQSVAEILFKNDLRQMSYQEAVSSLKNYHADKNSTTVKKKLNKHEYIGIHVFGEDFPHFEITYFNTKLLNKYNAPALGLKQYSNNLDFCWAGI
jgi:hypothetical protein